MPDTLPFVATNEHGRRNGQVFVGYPCYKRYKASTVLILKSNRVAIFGQLLPDVSWLYAGSFSVIGFVN
jgi:hypothetical protein